MRFMAIVNVSECGDLIETKTQTYRNRRWRLNSDK